MQSGYNTNIRHRGMLFHVQTEDGGAGNPRVVTHLFCGGTALASERSDYASQLEAPDLGAQVRERMQEQHRGMLDRLRRGAFDALIEERLSPSPSGDVTHPGGVGPGPSPADRAAPSSPAEPTAARGGVSRPLHELIVDYLVDRASRRPRPLR